MGQRSGTRDSDGRGKLRKWMLWAAKVVVSAALSVVVKREVDDLLDHLEEGDPSDE